MLLALELAERITMKRDLEIAREEGSREPLDGKGL
jgi:hypothetical protein